MLARWHSIAFIAQHIKRANDELARIRRVDHVLDVATGRGDIGVEELVVVFRDCLLALLIWVLRAADTVAENDVRRALPTP